MPFALPAGVQCCAVAGRLGPDSGALRGRLLGDGLVPVVSALGQHKTARHNLAFNAERQWIAQDTNHMALLSSPAVYAQLKRWLA